MEDEHISAIELKNVAENPMLLLHRDPEELQRISRAQSLALKENGLLQFFIKFRLKDDECKTILTYLAPRERRLAKLVCLSLSRQDEDVLHYLVTSDVFGKDIFVSVDSESERICFKDILQSEHLELVFDKWLEFQSGKNLNFKLKENNEFIDFCIELFRLHDMDAIYRLWSRISDAFCDYDPNDSSDIINLFLGKRWFSDIYYVLKHGKYQDRDLLRLQHVLLKLKPSLYTIERETELAVKDVASVEQLFFAITMMKTPPLQRHDAHFDYTELYINCIHGTATSIPAKLATAESFHINHQYEEEGTTPLLVAMAHHNDVVAEQILTAFADTLLIRAADNNGMTALRYAVQQDNIALLHLLLRDVYKDSYEPNSYHQEVENALFYAAKHGLVNVLRMLINHFHEAIFLRRRGEKRDFALGLVACVHHQDKAFQMLLDYYTGTTQPTPEHEDPDTELLLRECLVVACANGDFHIISTILVSRPFEMDTFICAVLNDSALKQLDAYGDGAPLSDLDEYIAAPSREGVKLIIPTTIAVKNNDLQLTKLLLDYCHHSFEILLESFMIACTLGSEATEMVELLDTAMQSQRKKTLVETLHVACKYGSEPVVKILCRKRLHELGDDREEFLSEFVAAEDSKGRTALFTAVQYNHSKVLQYLLEFDDHYKLTSHIDRRGISIMEVACYYGYFKIAQMLYARMLERKTPLESRTDLSCPQGSLAKAILLGRADVASALIDGHSSLLNIQQFFNSRLDVGALELNELETYLIVCAGSPSAYGHHILRMLMLRYVPTMFHPNIAHLNAFRFSTRKWQNVETINTPLDVINAWLPWAQGEGGRNAQIIKHISSTLRKDTFTGTEIALMEWKSYVSTVDKSAATMKPVDLEYILSVLFVIGCCVGNYHTVKIICRILKYNMNVCNAVDAVGISLDPQRLYVSPLMLACMYQQTDVALELIRLGANVNINTKQESDLLFTFATPLKAALYSKCGVPKQILIAILIKHNAVVLDHRHNNDTATLVELQRNKDELLAMSADEKIQCMRCVHIFTVFKGIPFGRGVAQFLYGANGAFTRNVKLGPTFVMNLLRLISEIQEFSNSSPDDSAVDILGDCYEILQECMSADCMFEEVSLSAAALNNYKEAYTFMIPDGAVLFSYKRNIYPFLATTSILDMLERTFFRPFVPSPNAIKSSPRRYGSKANKVEKIDIWLNDLAKVQLYFRYTPFNRLMLEGISRCLTVVLVSLVVSTQITLDHDLQLAEIFLAVQVNLEALYELGRLEAYGYNMYEFLYSDFWKIVDLIGFLFVYVWFWFRLRTEFTSHHIHKGPKFALAFAAIPLSVSLLRYLLITKGFGKLVNMVVTMSFEVARFLLIFIISCFGFMIFFYGLFYETGNEDGMAGPGAFQDFRQTLLTLFNAAMGNFNYNDVEDGTIFAGVGQAMLTIFVVWSAILLLNLLIARMTSAHDKFNNQALNQYAYNMTKNCINFLLFSESSSLCMLPAPFNLFSIAMMPVHNMLIRYNVRDMRLGKNHSQQDTTIAADKSGNDSGADNHKPRPSFSAAAQKAFQMFHSHTMKSFAGVACDYFLNILIGIIFLPLYMVLFVMRAVVDEAWNREDSTYFVLLRLLMKELFYSAFHFYGANVLAGHRLYSAPDWCILDLKRRKYLNYRIVRSSHETYEKSGMRTYYSKKEQATLYTEEDKRRIYDLFAKYRKEDG